MTEFYFDPETNKLVVGEAALAAQTAYHEMGDYDFEAPPADDEHGSLQSIPDLLVSETLPANIVSKPAERPKTSKWDAESTILVALDVGPSIKTIARRTKGLSQFRADASDELAIWKLRAAQAGPLPAAETYYDPQTQKLVIGKTALAAEHSRHEMGDYDFEEPPTDDKQGSFYSLPELLTNDSALPSTIGSDPSKRPRVARWNNESITHLSHWLFKQLRSVGDESIKKEHFEKLNRMDLGPSVDLINKKGGIPRLRIAVNDPGGRKPRTNSPEWSLSEWHQFAKKVEQSLEGGPRKPTYEDYQAASEKFGGPSYYYIQSFGVRKLNELIGYETEWHETTIVEWGAQVLLANPSVSNPLSRVSVEALSNKGVGPSSKLILRYCGNFPDFQVQAQERLREIMHEHAEHSQQRLDRFDQIVATTGRIGLLPDGLSDEEKLAFAARYDVGLKILGPQLEKTVWRFASMANGTFTRALCGMKPGLTDGEIELQAELMGFMDDIWPTHRDLDKLQLTEEDLQTVRARYAASKARFRHRTRLVSAAAPGDTISAGSSIQDVRSGIEASKEHGLEAIQHLEAARQGLEMAAGQLQQVGAGDGQLEQLGTTMYQITRWIEEIQAKTQGAVQGGDDVSKRL